jgi:DNA (cytosine-5)-methyltransferase 1
MKFIDWFAGAGGGTKSMKKAGHIPVGFCEIDKFAVKSYRAIHEPKEDEWYESDIRTVQPERVPDADCYCFGWPCQDNSIAGKRRGQVEGTRSGLLFEIARIMRVKKPSYFIAENVAGLFSVSDGRDFYQTIRLFTDLGYDMQWQLLNTVWFLPQNRERIYFVGHLRGKPRPEVFPIGENDQVSNRSFRTQGWSTAETAISGCLGGKQDRDYSTYVFQKTHGNCVTVNQDKTGTLQAARLDKVPCIPVLTPDREEKRQNGRRFKEPGEPMFTLTAQDIHGVAVIQQNQRKEVFIKEHAGTINQTMGASQSPKIIQRSRGNNDGGIFDNAPTLSKSSYEHNNHLFDGMQIRKLTPLECWRLQGWDDEDFYKAKAVNSDSQLYKQAGNGVSIPVFDAIATKL